MGNAAAEVVRLWGRRSDALIEVLHQLQQSHGHLSRPLLRQVALELQLPFSRVYGVASFYHLFRLEPPTPHRCAVCLGTACFVRGGGRLAGALEQWLGVGLDAPHGDAAWALEAVTCVGACGQAPVLVVDGELAPHLPVQQPDALGQRLVELGLPRQPVPCPLPAP
jgi:NADH:ubiquinone oxidoreductase subunit E